MFSILLPFGWEKTRKLSGAQMLSPDEIFRSRKEIVRLMKQNGNDQGVGFIKPAKGLEDGCVNMVCAEKQAGEFIRTNTDA